MKKKLEVTESRHSAKKRRMWVCVSVTYTSVHAKTKIITNKIKISRKNEFSKQHTKFFFGIRVYCHTGSIGFA